MALIRASKSSIIIFQLDYLKEDMFIARGDLIFTLSKSKVWVVSTRVVSKENYFKYKVEGVGLVDLEPVTLFPTWRKDRVWKVRVSKRLDRFFISKHLLNELYRIQAWLQPRGSLDHNPILIQMERHNENPTRPFKFNF